MVGFAALKHALRMMFYDLPMTLRLTMLPLLLVYAVTIASSRLVIGALGPGLAISFATGFAVFDAPQTETILALLVIVVVIVIALSWAAISWHRYSLLAERPTSILPPLNRALLLAYVVGVIRVTLITIAWAIPLAAILVALTFVASPFSPVVEVVTVVGMVLLMAQILRYSLILPAAALGQPMRLSEAASASRSHLSLFLFVSVLTFVIGYVGEEIVSVLDFAGILSFLFDWFNFALSLSLLTTLYGLCVEKRELDA